MKHHIELCVRPTKKGSRASPKHYSQIVATHARKNRIRFRSDDHKTRQEALAEAKALVADIRSTTASQTIRIVDTAGV